MSLQYRCVCLRVHVWQSALLTHLNTFRTVNFALFQKLFSLASRALPSIVIYLLVIYSYPQIPNQPSLLHLPMTSALTQLSSSAYHHPSCPPQICLNSPSLLSLPAFFMAIVLHQPVTIPFPFVASSCAKCLGGSWDTDPVKKIKRMVYTKLTGFRAVKWNMRSLTE